ncbi:MAG: GTPase HflX, partial [Planctomycetota bacterium]
MEKVRDQLKVHQERAILVGVILKRKEKTSNDDVLGELTALAESAGAVVVDRFIQKMGRVSAATYIGSGKAKMLAERVDAKEADVVIFDNDLSPAQIRELEKIVECKVLDRSELILDIFATRARTHQAKLQVELAQLEYTYPRLTRMWSHLDTVAGAGGAGGVGAVGGIGTRGTGEKQLEIDRRLVNKRITELKRNIAAIDKRKIREIDGRSDFYTISLVGYTNAGKSTLMNALTDAGVFVQDQLFATLDTRTRKWQVDAGVEVLLSDTVGFVSKLPHHLVASFKATLEETINADLLLHVVDASSVDVFEQIKSVETVLKELDCDQKDMLVLLNKSDCIADKAVYESVQTVFP